MRAQKAAPRALLSAVSQDTSRVDTESPVPLPALGEQLDRVVAAAAGHRFADRVQRLRTAKELFDVTYQLIG